jgi:hypothetical protein
MEFFVGAWWRNALRFSALRWIALPALNLRDEEHLGAGFYGLEIADLVELAIDGDGGFLLQVFA